MFSQTTEYPNLSKFLKLNYIFTLMNPFVCILLTKIN